MNTAIKMFDDSAFAEMARAAQSIEQMHTRLSEAIPPDFANRLSSQFQGFDFKNTIQWPEGLSDQIANSFAIPNHPALTSLSDSLADTAERMRRTFAAPMLVRQEPHIIEPSSEDIQAVVVESLPRPPVPVRGNTRYHELHFERAKEIYLAGFRMGPYQIAQDIIDERGVTNSRNDAVRSKMVLGYGANAAKHALGGKIKEWIAGGWPKPI